MKQCRYLARQANTAVQSPSDSLRAGLKALYAALTVVALEPLKLPTAALPKAILSPAEFCILKLLGYKQLKPQLALSDRQNILKVAMGRLDLAVIDRRVLSYLLGHDPEVKRLATGKVQFNDSLIELKTLHLALRRQDSHQQLMDKFNQQLQKVKSDSAELSPQVD